MNTTMFKILLILVLGVCGSKFVTGTFRFVTSYNKEGRILKSEDVEKTTVNVLKPIIFLISDQLQNDTIYNHLIEAYLERHVHNVFLVDLNEDGTSIAHFISTIYNKTGEGYLDIHLVSLLSGSEVVVAATKELVALSGKKVNRITALEPSTHLNKDENADFVEIVHSLSIVSKVKAEGDVTFYLDDRKCQELKDFGKLAATEVFAKSINSSKFKGVKCESVEDFETGKCEKNEKVTFGEDVDKSVRGSYFVAAC